MFLCFNTLSWAASQTAKEETVQFTPPPGWRYADVSSQLKRVRTMVVGEGKFPLRPSMNLMVDEYPGTKKEYIKLTKAISEASGAEWKDLGSIQTEAGNASLLQEDTKTEWGVMRMMHVVLLRQGMVYILTAAALKDEFSQFYPQFFKSLRSLKIQIPQQ